MHLIELKSGVGNEEDKRIIRRWNVTKRFIKSHLFYNGDVYCGGLVLDVGEKNNFGRKMAEEFGLFYCSTNGDLDYQSWTMEHVVKYDYIFCFEVIEHLMNPLLFLENLKSVCGDKTVIFLTYPNNVFKSEHHFHEYSDDEFFTLITAAGFNVLDFKTDRHWHSFWFYFTGFRPLARLAGQLTGKSKLNLWRLGIKND